MTGPEKSAAEKTAITAGLQKNEIFGNCTEEQLAFLVKGFTQLGVESGEVVISQGEPGDHFYVVGSGAFVASLEQKQNAVVAEYGEGDSFGELALLYNSPRAATVTCKEGGFIWALERKRFRYVAWPTAAALPFRSVVLFARGGVCFPFPGGVLASSPDRVYRTTAGMSW